MRVGKSIKSRRQCKGREKVWGTNPEDKEKSLRRTSKKVMCKPRDPDVVEG